VGSERFTYPPFSREEQEATQAWAWAQTWCRAQICIKDRLTECGFRMHVRGPYTIPLCKTHGAIQDPLVAFRFYRLVLRALNAPGATPLDRRLLAEPVDVRRRVLKRWLASYRKELRHEMRVGVVEWIARRRLELAGGARPVCPGCGCGEGAVCRITFPGGEGVCAPAGSVPGHRVCSGCVTAHGAGEGVEIEIPLGRYGARNAPPGPFTVPKGLGA
jgi:hypothetical protein